MRRPLSLLKISLALTGLLFAWSAYADEFDDALLICAKAPSHVESKNCGAEVADTSSKALQAAESKTVFCIFEQPNYSLRYSSLREQDDAFKTNMKVAASEAAKSFESYRNAQCHFEMFEAGGGTGGGDLINNCIIRLNRERMHQLEQFCNN